MDLSWKRKMTIIWFGQSISLLTSMILQMCLIWYLTLRTESAAVITIATLAGFLPQAFLGPVVGAVIDRFPKKIVIISADLAIALSSLLLAFLMAQGEVPIPLILLMLVIRSLGASFHEPAVHSLTPLLVPKENLTQYAGFTQAFDTISSLLSPALSVVLYELWSLEFIILLDVFGAGFGVLCLGMVAIPVKEKEEKQPEKMNIWRETKEGLALMGSISGIFPLMFVGFAYTMCYSPVGSLYPHITMVYFGGSTTESAFVEVIFSVGTLLGALLLGRYGQKLNQRWGLFGSIFAYGLGAFAIGTLAETGFFYFVAISFCMGVSIPFYHGVSRAIYQQKIPQEYLGRAFALAQSARRMGMPVGLLVGGQFADGIGVNILYICAGCGAMALAVWGLQIKSMKDF